MNVDVAKKHDDKVKAQVGEEIEAAIESRKKRGTGEVRSTAHPE